MIVRAALLLAALAACLAPHPVTAQSAPGCTACIAGADCDGKRDSCAAECRARLFSIDPRRAACITDCSARATQCARAADIACRARGLCP